MNMKMIWNPCQRLTRMKTETRCQHLTLIQTRESVELLNGEVEEPISEEELFMYHKVQEADECDEWLDCYGAGILCGCFQ